ncbi:insulinase family protein [Chitinophagaceae bacterium MMS25-I14]
MKKITLSIFTLALLSSAGYAQTLDRSIRPKAGPAPEVKLGKTETFTLPNGLKVFVVENHKLPTVEYSIQLDVKPELEGDMAGYQDLIGELMTAGTKTRSKDKLNEEIDFIGASINASSKSISGGSLKKHQQKLLELMSDVALNADFKQTELDNLKTRALSGLEASKNDPDAMLKNVAAVINYGSKHPYGEVTTDATLKKATLERCKKYYSTYFRPNVAYMAVVGDITAAEVKPLIEKYFGGWQKGVVPVAQYTKAVAPAATRVAFVPRDAAVQSVIDVTYPADLKIGTQDVIKARVANAILGDGSQGRLFLNLREKHGWTYGAYSSLSPDELVGNFTAYAKCRNAVTDSSVNEIITEMKRMQTETVDATSLQNTIAYLSGQFAIGLEDPARVAQYAINIERYKMPKDYYQNYLKSLAAVSAEDVKAISAKYISPDKANIVVVGNKDEVSKKLEAFGKVSYYDNYGRPLKTEAPKAAAAGVTADVVYKKYVDAIGGEKALGAIKDLRITMSSQVQGMALELVEAKKTGSKYLSTVKVMGQTYQKTVLNGDKGYQEAGGKKMDMTAEEVAQTKEKADPQSDLHQAMYGNKRELKGIEKVGDADAYVVEMTSKDGKKAKEYYSVATGLKIKEVSPEGSQEFSDYKEIPGTNGFKVPHSIKINQQGQAMEISVVAVEVNKGIDDASFQ